MCAIALPHSGSAPQIVEIDVPEPAEGAVRVRVHAASVNGFEEVPAAFAAFGAGTLSRLVITIS